jgi:hypothetical protein
LTVRTLAVVVALVALAGACSGGSEKATGPDYEPVPDRELFSRIGRLPGVISTEIQHRDTFNDRHDYVGTVTADAKVDPVRLLDQVIAVLRQGRWQASMSLHVRQPDRTTTIVDLGLRSAGEPDLTERYGPQPGDGRPPEQ